MQRILGSKGGENTLVQAQGQFRIDVNNEPSYNLWEQMQKLGTECWKALTITQKNLIVFSNLGKCCRHLRGALIL